MGGPKALLDHNGRPWILALCEALAEVVPGVRVVLGAEAERIAGLLPPEVEVVVNPDWASTDMAGSLRRGLADVEPGRRVLVCPVDLPPPPARVLRDLLAIQGQAVACHEGEDGHPVVIRARPLAVGETLRDLLVGAVRVRTDWPGAVVNLNTPSDLRTWQDGEKVESAL